MPTKVQWDAQTRENLQEWLEGDYDQATKEELRRLMAEDPDAITEGFYTKLSFGTAGLRGVMGLGPNRLNKYTVGAATQGLANYLKKQIKGECRVLIGYDSRLHSREFAIEAARVFAGNGITVQIYRELRPVPMVSFGCLATHSHAAVMITASHNPPQYNGYKVYWSYGGQVLPPHDKGIIDEVNKILQPSQVRSAEETNPRIHWVEHELDDAYIQQTHSLQTMEGQNRTHGHQLRVVYTALHGTGITMVPRSLADWGFTQVIGVTSQNRPDGTFPTIKVPNPEEHSVMQMGIDLLKESEGDLLLATDADADRLGVVVMHRRQPFFLDGNQIACLGLDHLLGALQAQGRLSPRAAAVKSIVTTELFEAIADHYHTACFDVLPGFKYIGELITRWQQDPVHSPHYVFGAEESYGCLVGTHARDKDAVIACSLLCELALDLKLRGLTLIDRLYELYRRHGVYREHLASLMFTGKTGAEQMQQVMTQLRENSPTKIGPFGVEMTEDFLTSTKRLHGSSTTEKLSLPRSNVLRFWLEDGTKVVVRPSGTEPKMKIYVGLRRPSNGQIEEAIRAGDREAQDLLGHLKRLIQPTA
jgi:phosphomannomutase